MNAKPLVSIIMPVYNSEKTVKKSIISVLNQTYDNWELIVINDGSKDNSIEILKRFNDNRIFLVEQENQGVVKARNNGMKSAKGEFIAFLDSDDIWVSNKLEIQIGYLLSTNKKFSYSKSFCFRNDEALCTNCFTFVHINFTDKEKILVYDYIPTLTVVMHKDIITTIGYFDEKLKSAEDWDYWIRILQKYEACYINEFLAKYRVSNTGLSGNLQKHFIEEEKVWQKHMGLYSKKIMVYRQWFSDKKQAIIAKQNDNIFDFVRYFMRLLKLPKLLIKFLIIKYYKVN